MTPLSEDWLKASGFLWSQGERRPHKHWRLLLGWAVESQWKTPADLAIEVSMAWWPNTDGLPIGDTSAWSTWLTGMNNSLLHVRDIRTVEELVALIEALTGLSWCADHAYAGILRTPEQHASLGPHH